MKKKVSVLFQKHNKFGLYMVLLVGISLIPLLLTGRYNVMSADDYAMGKEFHRIFGDTPNIANTLGYAFTHMTETYRMWQGCFTVNFFDSLNPGFWGESLTWITPMVMLFSMLFSLYLFVKAMISYFFEGTKEEIGVVFGVISFLTIQTMPSPVEGIYWYSGAIAYTFLHYLMLVLFCVILRMEIGENKCRRIIWMIIAALYAFLVGGTQYITVLECMLWYAVFLMLNYRKLKWWKIFPGITLLCGFLVSFFGPGNALRRQDARGLNPVAAILQSFIEAVRYGKTWLSPIMVISIFFLLPFVWKIVRKQKCKYTYKYPLAVLVGSYCIFSAAFTPALYGVGNVDAGRIQNLIQSVFYILLLVDLFYLVGWAQHKMDSAKEGFYWDLCAVKNILKKYSWIYNWVMFVGILVVLIGTGDKNTFSSMSAFRSLILGEAQTYYSEAQERLEIYRDESNPMAMVEAFSVKPKVLYFTDIVPEGDINYWINESVAEYYGKEKVVLKDSAE